MCLPARPLSRRRSATGAGTPFPLSASSDCSSNPAIVDLSSVSIADAAARLASACSRWRRYSAALISRTRRAAPESAKLICSGIASPACRPDCFCCCRIAFGQRFVQYHRVKFTPLQYRQSCPAILSYFDYHAQLRAHRGSAVACSLNSSHHQNAHLNSLYAALGLWLNFIVLALRISGQPRRATTRRTARRLSSSGKRKILC